MSKEKSLSFENAMLNLEDSISKIESGNLSLDDSIAEFEKAVGLIKICESKLSAANQKVRMLTECEDGTITDVPFTSEEDAT